MLALFVWIKIYTQCHRMTQDEIHIGSLIYDKLKENRRSTSWLAQKLHCDRTNIYKIFKKSSIDTALLLKINLALKIDFFVYYTDIYKDTVNKWNILSTNWLQNVDKSATKTFHSRQNKIIFLHPLTNVKKYMYEKV